MKVTTRTIPGLRSAGPNYGMIGARMRAEPWKYDEGSADRFSAKLKAGADEWKARCKELGIKHWSEA